MNFSRSEQLQEFESKSEFDLLIIGGGIVGSAALEMAASSCLLYTSPSPRDAHESRMPSSA